MRNKKKDREKYTLEQMGESYWQNFSVVAAAVIFGTLYIIKNLIVCLVS